MLGRLNFCSWLKPTLTLWTCLSLWIKYWVCVRVQAQPPGLRRSEVNFPLAASPAVWGINVNILQGLLRSTDGPLGKETLVLRFCSAGFAEFFFRLSALSSSCVAAGLGFEQSCLPPALSLCADPAPLLGSQQGVNSFPWQALQREPAGGITFS